MIADPVGKKQTDYGELVQNQYCLFQGSLLRFFVTKITK